MTEVGRGCYILACIYIQVVLKMITHLLYAHLNLIFFPNIYF